MNKLTISDFKNDSEYISFESKTSVWNRSNIFVYVDFPREEDSNECLEKCIDAINQQLDWVESNRNNIEEALIEKDFLSLAEDWASSAEEADDEEQECYIMEDDQKVFFPITEADFKSSLYINSISINFEESLEFPVLSVYLMCNPDYFACHCIDIYIDKDKKIQSASLAG